MAELSGALGAAVLSGLGTSEKTKEGFGISEIMSCR